MILKTNNSFRLGDKVKHINGDTIYRIRTMNPKFIVAVDKDADWLALLTQVLNSSAD